MNPDRDTSYAIFKILSETLITDRIYKHILLAVRSDMTMWWCQLYETLPPALCSICTTVRPSLFEQSLIFEMEAFFRCDSLRRKSPLITQSKLTYCYNVHWLDGMTWWSNLQNNRQWQEGKVNEPLTSISIWKIFVVPFILCIGHLDSGQQSSLDQQNVNKMCRGSQQAWTHNRRGSQWKQNRPPHALTLSPNRSYAHTHTHSQRG